MALVINSNIPSLNAQRNLSSSQTTLSTSLQRLSSGLRINSAKDDAAGLAISERMTSQVRGLNQAIRNANDGISLSQTGEGALTSMGDILQRVRELAVQSANSSNSGSDRNALQSEVTSLVQELDRISQTTEFNGQKLFDGSFGTATFQIGANANQVVQLNTASLRTTSYGNNQVEAANVGTLDAAAFGANGLTGGTLTVAGYIGTEAITYGANSSAKAIASAVNQQTASTGVTAAARTDVELTFGTSGAYILNVRSDNATVEQVSFNVSTTNTPEGLAEAVQAFNDKSAKSGVTASLNSGGDGIIISNLTGQDIQVSDTISQNAGAVTVQALDSKGVAAGGAGTLVADTNANDSISMGYVLFNSERSFSVDDDQDEVTNSAGANSSTLKDVATIDVTTFGNATDALYRVDSALTTVNNLRARLGAMQSRFENTISNLSTTSENISGARSRIRDADFAQETANMTRAQILQQAGVAMLAQANSLPNQVLTLLQG